jgi:hypothetical protein
MFVYPDFCKQLSKKEALGQASSESEGEGHPSSGSDTERPFHHPFQIKERPASIVMNIRVSVEGDRCAAFIRILLPESAFLLGESTALHTLNCDMLKYELAFPHRHFAQVLLKFV